MRSVCDNERKKSTNPRPRYFWSDMLTNHKDNHAGNVAEL